MDSSSHAPETIDLAGRLAQIQRIFLIFSSVVLVLLGAAATSVVSLVPRFEKIFYEMLGDKPLPSMTTLSIRLAESGNGFLSLLFTAVLPLAMVVTLVMHPRKEWVWWSTLCVAVFLLLLVVAIPLSLSLPLLTIVTEMSSQ